MRLPGHVSLATGRALDFDVECESYMDKRKVKCARCHKRIGLEVMNLRPNGGVGIYLILKEHRWREKGTCGQGWCPLGREKSSVFFEAFQFKAE